MGAYITERCICVHHKKSTRMFTEVLFRITQSGKHSNALVEWMYEFWCIHTVKSCAAVGVMILQLDPAARREAHGTRQLHTT